MISVTIGDIITWYNDDREGHTVTSAPVIKTHEKIQFVYQFYDPQTNSNLAEMKYDIAIFQNGVKIFRNKGLS